MADWHQALYDDYVQEYGKPKLPKHLIAYSKKKSKHTNQNSLKFSEAKQLLLTNINRDNSNKNQTVKAKPNDNKNKDNGKNKRVNATVKTNGKTKAKPKDKGKDESMNNKGKGKGKGKAGSMNNKGKEPVKRKSKNNIASIFGSLSAVIKPLSSVKPIEVSQKSDKSSITAPFGANDDIKDRENDIKYKTKKNKKGFKKKKGTGSTPKPILLIGDDDVPKPPKEGPRRKLTPIPKPPKKGKKGKKILTLTSKYEKNSKKKKLSKKNKKKNKWDRDKEREIVLWINKTMNQDIIKINGRSYLQNILENGQLLCRLINKISPGMIDKKVIKQKPNIREYDLMRINCFISSVKELGVNDNVFDVNALFIKDNDGTAMMTVLNTLSALKKEIKSRDKRQSPLYLWCKYNNISMDIIKKLESSKYDLQRLFSLKSDEIEKTLSNELTLNDKLKLMKCIVKLKQINLDCNEWILLKEDIYCNLKTKDILNINNKKDAKQFIIPALTLCNNNNCNFILSILSKYFDEEWFIEELLSVLSRMKSKDINIKDIENIKDVSPILITEESLYSTDLTEMEATKLSYNLMELLTREVDIIDRFLSKYCSNLILHALSVFFYSKSCGNAYHSRILCDFLLDKYPSLLLSVICADCNSDIRILLRYAMFTQLDHGNLNSFILELVSFTAKTAQDFEFKKRIISLFIDWKFVDYILFIAPSYSNYALFLQDLVSRCSFDSVSYKLFVSCDIMTPFIVSGLLNPSLSTFCRITCCQTVCAILDILKMPSLVVEQESEEEEHVEQKNYLHSILFESSLNVIYTKYYKKLCNIVLNSSIEKEISLNCCVIASPFGPLRWHCLELIGITVDLSMLNAAAPLSKLKISFFERLLDLLFLHFNNNFFLNQFRRLIHLSMLFRRRILKHLCLNCNLLRRLICFYKDLEERTELHSFIIQMLWNFYNNDQQQQQHQMTTNFSSNKEDKFDIFAHFGRNNEWNSYFLPIIELEMKSRVLTQDIDLYPDVLTQDNDDDYCDDDNLNLNNDDIFNWNPFREEIAEQNLVPNIEYMSHFGLFKDYRFDITSSQHVIKSKSLLYISYCFAQTRPSQYYMMLRWNLNKKHKLLSQPKSNINLMIVLDHSNKMGHSFNEECRTKMEITAQIIYSIFENVLNDNDRFGLISFNHEAYLDFDLNFKSQYSLDQIRDCCDNMRSCGDSDGDQAYYRAIESFDDIKEEGMNRILFITTQSPSEPISLLNSVQNNAQNLNVFSTFISLSSEFNLNIISHLFDISGCNYFHIQSEEEFKAISFANCFFPIYFDINLQITNENNAESGVNEIFGGMMNDNEREYRCNTGYIQSVKTLFANSVDDEYRYNINRDIRLIKLNENVSQNLKISITINDGQEEEEEFIINLNKEKELPYFDNLSIRKAILLTKYMNLLKEWIQNTDKTRQYFSVNDEYKLKFKSLINLFDDDITLQRELDVIEKLAHYHEESANILRDLAKFDK